ncbi:NAD-dependent succinate-semialdehyde dehydrogenase [Nitrobacter winogradskyi]|uniref:NAD-dependent succinate-semialdehyde dehydrogenase n=2 Tax=Nitrobacter winogradskyi TaxID=913 RepID=A0A4Y3WCT1_NITWI|nr:NAD-dependent succinate-semialdehyde dehydrogenase [Nitrobacter winogradskyi]MCP1998503.1 succinate-semialdehyde dehydrogenase/glutarate-semialdehyde dehydrogenase [Nitrobacter winogradskyi]GEC16734.1 NAD-dependent succinate-semialdehyde dehydrogenase [Nitrobacter winogradskyi]
MSYQDTSLLIDGRWRPGASGRTIAVLNPATEEQIGTVAHADRADLDEALAAADKGFKIWRAVAPFERARIMRRAAVLMRERVERIATLMTMEQGKVLAEARIETLAAADVIEWFAEESRRAYGRVIPARGPGIYQIAIKEPVGPAAAFTPWNFPINQVCRKLSAALAAGCSIIVKAPEETPASPAELLRAFVDAGVPDGVINLVFGVPAEISEYLIPHPVIRKISFTGSTAVGKRLAALAGLHMKRATMELGGHAPAIVFDDADIASAVKIISGAKFRNAGQVCIAPTRLLVQDKVYKDFVDQFTEAAKAVRVGNGLDPDSTMGSLANSRRVSAVEGFVQDAVGKGGRLATGGHRVGNKGYFFEPTVLADVSKDARAMNEEPFGPLALISPFSSLDEAVEESNRLPYGLASYAFTSSTRTATAIGAAIESGMVAINNVALALPENPFGGVKDSGYGSEGGIEAMESYLITKFISQTGV